MKIIVKNMIGQVLLGAFVCLFLNACGLKKEEKPVSPPPTFPLSQSYIVGYGVVNVSYTRVNVNIEESGPSAGYLRQGSVVRIIERRLVKNEGKPEVWVLVEGNARGWLKESLIDIYGNEDQANTAASQMKN